MLTQTCTIKRRTTTQDASVNGGPISTWANVATLVPCSVQLESAREGYYAGREAGVRVYDAYFAYGQDITNECQVVLGSQVLSVIAVVPDDVGRQAYRRVQLKEVLGEPPV